MNKNIVVKFSEMVEVVQNNDECVVLKVKEDKKVDLVCLGYFNGDELMIRLTKGDNQRCTIWTNKGHYSWEWGINGFTLVNDSLEKRGRIIEQCIEYCFNIPVTWRHTKISLKDKYYMLDKQEWLESL